MHGTIGMIMAKVTDDISLPWDINWMKKFCKLLMDSLKVRKTLIDEQIDLNGCGIRQEREGKITMNMKNLEPSKRSI